MREDYSADGDAWAYLPHDHARSRAYRWGEDGMAGFSDVEQRLCLGLALWNGRDPILKERMFGLTGAQANHGEDVKEYWWYLDAVPSHAWNRWRYHYPQAAFPYDDLLAENGRRGKLDAEYELLDTGVFDEDRYWIVEVDYVKADPDRRDHGDPGHQRRTRRRHPARAADGVVPQHVVVGRRRAEAEAARRRRRRGRRSATRSSASSSCWVAPASTAPQPTALFCENETNTTRLFGTSPATPFPKDGINDHVVDGAATVNPRPGGHQGVVLVPARRSPAARPPRCGSAYDRRAPSPKPAEALGTDLDRGGRPAPSGGRRVLRRDVTPPAPRRTRRWSCARPSPACSGASSCTPTTCSAGWTAIRPSHRRRPSRRSGRNARWSSFDAFDIMSMPDKWEYPWFAAWDLGFHCVALAHVDPAFAKYQLLLLCREWFQHPNGALPAYEWDFGDVNPPVQAWAALEVFAIDGARDLDFLSRVFDKLLVNFTWWVNLEDSGGSSLFEGGFLGLDNIGPLDRSHLPVGGTLEQSDATGWMAFYALAMAAIASILNRSGHRPASDLALKFLEHFAAIRRAMDTSGLWDDDEGLYYDQLITPTGTAVPVKVRSMVGIIPLLAAVVLDEHELARAETIGQGIRPAGRGLRWPQGPHRAGPDPRRTWRPARCCSASSGWTSWRSSSPSCSTRTSSCRRTGSAPSRRSTASIPTSSTSRACAPRSTTSRPNRRPRCSAETRTGGGRSGSRSTTS